MEIDYSEERGVCEYLGLKVDKVNQVLAYYGLPHPDNISGWQVVCHLSKLKLYISRKIHIEHHKHINKEKQECSCFGGCSSVVLDKSKFYCKDD